MASKLPKKLFDVQLKLKTWSIRIQKFFKHKLLSQRKNILLIDRNSPPEFKHLLLNKLNKTWNITQLSLTSLEGPQTSSGDPQIISQSIDNKKGIEVVQNRLIGKHYDSIIVLPSIPVSLYNLQEEKIISQYNPTDDILASLLAYRLAHKYLSTSGVLILSTSQEDFVKQDRKKLLDQEKNKQLKLLKEKQKKNDQNAQSEVLKNKQIEKSLESIQKITATSKFVFDCQITYLGTIVGDRDFTDLSSWSIISLSQEVAQTDPQFVTTMYANWADGIRVPMPGSFALFKRKEQNNTKCSFVEYL